MFSAIRKRLHVSPSMVIAVTALVFATTGGAFAMSGAGSQAKTTASTAKAKSKAKAKTGPRGPAGPAGKNGAAGAPGAAGPQGPAGAPGAAGAKGEAGTAGAAGNEGAKGSTGPEGPEGPSGPAGPTCPGGKCLLPAKATETGTWQFQKLDENGSYPVNVSFPLRLGAAPTTEVVRVGETNPECPGTAAEPAAKPGAFCFYVSREGNVEEAVAESSADPTSGAEVTFVLLNERLTLSAQGSWAVTSQ